MDKTNDWTFHAPPTDRFRRPVLHRCACAGEVGRLVRRRVPRARLQGDDHLHLPDGRKGKLWLSQDGSYAAAGRRGDKSSGPLDGEGRQGLSETVQSHSDALRLLHAETHLYDLAMPRLFQESRSPCMSARRRNS